MNVLVSIFSPIRMWNIPDAHVRRLRECFPHHRFLHARGADETDALAPDAEIAFSSLIRPSTLAAAPRLTWIHSPAAGVGSMLFPEMIASPVVLTNSRGTHADAMAEHVIGVMLAMLRKLPEAVAHQAARRWAHDEMSTGRPHRLVKGSTVGIIGPGSIGGAIARLAAALGARVEAIRRRPDLGCPEGVHAVFAPADLHARLPAWDTIVLAVPLTPATRGLIGARELALMKPEAILINVGRGKVIRESDLVAALRDHRIAGAALDVVEREPLDESSPLWDVGDVLITPHTSSLRADYWDITTDVFAENLRRRDAGEPLLNVVDKHAGY
jgi:phosphoglycerate dehydrogenase-like enzyme